VNKTEISKLEAYLRRTFGNEDIIVRDSPGDPERAHVLVGSDTIADIYRDEDEGELSWSVEATLENLPVKDLELRLRELFFTRDLIVKARARKEDSVEVHVGDEFIGIAFREEDKGGKVWKFNMAVLELDLQGA